MGQRGVSGQSVEEIVVVVVVVEVVEELVKYKNCKCSCFMATFVHMVG